MLNKNFIIILLSVAVLLLVSPWSQGIAYAQNNSCIDKNGTDRDSCYSDQAQSINDCAQIESGTWTTECLEKFLPNLSTTTQCDNIPEKFKVQCYATVTLNIYPDNISKCYDLLFSYQKECVETYIHKKNISDPNYCNNIKNDFQRSCAYQATLNKYPPFSNYKTKLSEDVCNGYQGEIKNGCLDYVHFLGVGKKFLTVFLSMFAIFGGMFLFVTLVPILATLIILIVMKRRQKKGIVQYPPSKGVAIAGLLLNLFVLPGMGTILTGELKQGSLQFLLSAIGWFTAFLGIGFVLLLISWIWALVTSIETFKNIKK